MTVIISNGLHGDFCADLVITDEKVMSEKMVEIKLRTATGEKTLEEFMIDDLFVAVSAFLQKRSLAEPAKRCDMNSCVVDHGN